jgi:hypothetical protein
MPPSNEPGPVCVIGATIQLLADRRGKFTEKPRPQRKSQYVAGDSVLASKIQTAKGLVGGLGDLIIGAGAPKNAVFGGLDSFRAPYVRGWRSELAPPKMRFLAGGLLAGWQSESLGQEQGWPPSRRRVRQAGVPTAAYLDILACGVFRSKTPHAKMSRCQPGPMRHVPAQERSCSRRPEIKYSCFFGTEMVS